MLWEISYDMFGFPDGKLYHVPLVWYTGIQTFWIHLLPAYHEDGGTRNLYFSLMYQATGHLSSGEHSLGILQ
jgi:hypothetical protein